ncbi:hypothetical protein M3193_07505 [Sporosarcina luteola]|uniref:hypothetical protein n=1 Tax=Sporosarcina luteola TaxID=582850 RepID=UPI002040944E|nr:hypothetical protein [Sporosarcina luteola]MCM3743988.1 hypothetical protein [Sporosarcina luteola]
MKEFKITYFFDEEHYIRRFIHTDSMESAEQLVELERDQYISFRDSRGIYHELHTGKVRVVQVSEYFREDKEKRQSR